MKTTIKTSRGPVRFQSIGEPIAGIPAKPIMLAYQSAQSFLRGKFNGERLETALDALDYSHEIAFHANPDETPVWSETDLLDLAEVES